jgi:hypothetical protein
MTRSKRRKDNTVEDAEDSYRNLSTKHVSSILYDNITSPHIQIDEF